MAVNPDFRDLLNAFNAHRVEYLVVGAHAVIYYTRPRYTKDLDLWVNPTLKNAQRVWNALRAFGAPLKDISMEEFARLDAVYQIGIEPNRIDVLTEISRVRFATAWRNRRRTTYGGVPIHVIGRSELIKTKRAAGRTRDLEDAAELERSGKKRQRSKRPHRRPAREK